jgi:hypothetical protein
MKITLCETIYRCKVCNSMFKEFNIQEYAYGEFILFNRSRRKVCWEAIDEPVFKELSQLVKSVPKIANLASYKHVPAFRALLGIACDRDEDGSLFKFPPYCPTCGSGKTKFYSRTEPLDCREMDIEKVTHNTWNSLSESEKRRLVTEAVNELDFNDL